MLKRLVLEMYSDIDDSDSVLLRLIVQRIGSSDIAEVWDGEVVDCLILENSVVES